MMQVFGQSWLRIVTLALVAYLPIAHADYVNQQEFANNGSIASVLENSIDQYLMPYEVQQIGNAVYNVGQSYGALGQEMTSSTPQMDFVTKHVSGYCSPNISLEAQFFQCTGQTGNLNNDAVSAQFLEMGDIRTSVLLEPLMYTPVINIAAQNFIRNITMPFPTQIYGNYISNQATFAKNSSQRIGYANYMTSQALLGVARYALDEMYAMRVAGSTMGGSANSGAAAGSSIMQVMESEASQRFFDPNYVPWLTAASTTPQQIVIDMAAVQAFSIWMQYQSYRQNERIVTLLSAMLANTVSSGISGMSTAMSAGATPSQ